MVRMQKQTAWRNAILKGINAWGVGGIQQMLATVIAGLATPQQTFSPFLISTYFTFQSLEK